MSNLKSVCFLTLFVLLSAACGSGTERDDDDATGAGPGTPETTPSPSPGPPTATPPPTPTPTSRPPTPTPPPEPEPTPLPISQPSPGDVVIAEIMIDPRLASDDSGEWFEVLNTATDKRFNLVGWTITDLDGRSHVIYNEDLELILEPRRRLVMGVNSNEAINGGINVDYSYNNMDFLNSGSDGVSISSGGMLIDSVIYDLDGAFAHLEGHSISLDPEASDATLNDNGANWCVSFTLIPGSTDYGTPGLSNKACSADLDGDSYPEEIDCDDANAAVNPGMPEDRDNDVDDDCDGSVDEQSAYGHGDLLITEIMYNPSDVEDAFGEWFEVYNTTVESISMEGWTIADEDNAHVVNGTVVVPANERIVLGVNNSLLTNGGVIVSYAYAGILLDNANDPVKGNADTLQLEFDNVVVDSVVYQIGGEFPTAEGASIFLRNDVFSASGNDEGENWCLSYEPYSEYSDYGSPGIANPECAADTDNDGVFDLYDCEPENPAVYPGAEEIQDNGVDEDCDGSVDEYPAGPGEVIITELMVDPTNVTDGAGEYIEIFNTSLVDIDVNGWTLTDDGGDAHTIRAGSALVIAPQAYLVLGINADPDLNGGIPVDYQYDYDFELDDRVDQVILADGGTIIDEVRYDVRAGWPLQVGHALSLDPASFDHLSNDSGSNWCPASTYIPPGVYTDFGTPGAENDDCDGDGS